MRSSKTSSMRITAATSPRSGAAAVRLRPTAPNTTWPRTASWLSIQSATVLYGGIAYHHVADTYIALFSHFIPCGVWEAIYILEGLLKNTSEVQPTTVHGDNTQAQSTPVFGLAHLLGIKLMPRIRNWKDLRFFRPTKETGTSTSTICSATRSTGT